MLKKGLDFRRFLAPFSCFLRFGRPRVPKGAPRSPRDCQSAHKDTKKEPKGHKNGAQSDRTCGIVARKVTEKLSEIIDSIINQRKRSDGRVCGDMYVYIYTYISATVPELARARECVFGALSGCLRSGLVFLSF